MEDPKLNLEQRIIERSLVTTFLKKYWPTIASVAGVLVSFLMPSVDAYAASHEKTALGVLFTAIIAAYHSTAPKHQQ